MLLNNKKVQSATDIGILLLMLLLSINQLPANCRIIWRHSWERINSELNTNHTKFITSFLIDYSSQLLNKPLTSPIRWVHWEFDPPDLLKEALSSFFSYAISASSIQIWKITSSVRIFLKTWKRLETLESLHTNEGRVLFAGKASPLGNSASCVPCSGICCPVSSCG